MISARDQRTHGVVHQHNIVGRGGDRVERVLDRLLAVLAADDQFNFLFQDIVCFFAQALAESFNLVFAQRDPDFADRIDRGELAQRVNEDGRASQVGELLRGMRLLRLRVHGAGHGRHARPQARSRNNHNHLHSGV